MVWVSSPLRLGGSSSIFHYWSGKPFDLAQCLGMLLHPPSISRVLPRPLPGTFHVSSPVGCLGLSGLGSVSPIGLAGTGPLNT